MLLTNLFFFTLSAIVLIVSGSLLVRSLVKLASFLKLSEFVAAFIIMAFATSLPELFIGITSSLSGNGALSLGNIIGANILNLTLIAGIIILLGKGIKVKSHKIRKDSLYMFFIVIVPMLLMYIGGSLSRFDGVILLILFFFYMRYLIKQRKKFKKGLEDHVKKWDVVLSVFIFIISLILLFVSADFVVKYALALSLDLLLPPIFIGLFIVSLGTTLPELVFESRAVLTAHPEMALGNLIGSVVINSTLILGIASLINPISANFLLFVVSAVFMVVTAFLFSTFLESGGGLSWKEGVSLIMLYMFFIMVEFYVRGISV